MVAAAGMSSASRLLALAVRRCDDAASSQYEHFYLGTSLANELRRPGE
jgi:hypothetical protein